MFVVTFYSYKGGVGRTLALVNCAFSLARQGKKVFILDFDLEAPGIDSFRLCGDGQTRQGIVEYISRFRAEGDVGDLSAYVCEVDPTSAQPGQVRFMSAGRKDEEYQVLLSKLDWKNFYQQQQGYLFVENLKAAIEKVYAPDYVLIDSRTGLTDIAGICTLQLPDLVVLIFNLNNQNVGGISQIYRSIRFNKLDKVISILLVASPIPDVSGYSEKREARIKYALGAIGAEKVNLIVPFDPFLAFEETILGTGQLNTPLGTAYESLSRMIRKENKTDVLTMLEEAGELVRKGNIEQADLKFRETVDSHPDEPRALLDYARFLRIRESKDAIRYLERARQLDPHNHELVGQLIRTYFGLGQVKDAISNLDEFLAASSDADEIESLGKMFEMRGMVEPARRLFERAIELAKSPERGPHLDLGNAFMALKKPDLAVREYELLLKNEPVSLAAVYNYAYVLSQLGDPRAAGYFERAIEIFERKGEGAYVGKLNPLQAMGRAYAFVGKKKKALELLKDAFEGAKKEPPSQRVFSSVQYKYIPVKEFIQETGLLKRKLGQR